MGSRILLVLPGRNMGGTRFGTLYCSDIFDSYVDSMYVQYCRCSASTFRFRPSTDPAGVGRNWSRLPKILEILGGINNLGVLYINITASIAQLVERVKGYHEVPGSIPGADFPNLVRACD